MITATWLLSVRMRAQGSVSRLKHSLQTSKLSFGSVITCANSNGTHKFVFGVPLLSDSEDWGDIPSDFLDPLQHFSITQQHRNILHCQGITLSLCRKGCEPRWTIFVLPSKIWIFIWGFLFFLPNHYNLLFTFSMIT